MYEWKRQTGTERRAEEAERQRLRNLVSETAVLMGPSQRRRGKRNKKVAAPQPFWAQLADHARQQGKSTPIERQSHGWDGIG